MDNEAVYMTGYEEGVRECALAAKDAVERLTAENAAFWREIVESEKAMSEVAELILPPSPELIRLRQQAEHLENLIHSRRVHGERDNDSM